MDGTGGTGGTGGTAAQSYRYLRLAIVGLLVALAVSVLYQSVADRAILSSVSAYYYTPAQGVFVGALIGLGACMIALKGTTPLEDVTLNVGGVLAAVVAIIPTSRGDDYQTALDACSAGSPVLTGRAPDCPDVTALAAATRANVENNASTLLAIGLLAIVAALAFLWWDRRTHHDAGPLAPKAWGFVVVGLVWLAGFTGRVWFLDRLVDHGHYIAAFGLLASVLVVAGANARRREVDRGTIIDGRPSQQLRVVVQRSGRNAYAWIALALLVCAGIGVVALFLHAVSVFWVEIVVAGLFAVFWTVQTVEIDT